MQSFVGGEEGVYETPRLTVFEACLLQHVLLYQFLHVEILKGFHRNLSVKIVK